MPIFEHNARRVLFIHIPKTGGTSIESLLSTKASMTFFSPKPPNGLKVCPQHLTFNDLEVLLGKSYWDWSFTIVRNPYRRLESEYRFRTGLGSHRYGKETDFSTWVVKSIENVKKDRCFWDNHFRPQTDFMAEGVSIFKFEEGLNPAVRQAADQLDIELEKNLERKNVSEKKSVSWTRETLDLVNEYYQDDFDFLDYQQKKRGKYSIGKIFTIS